MASPFLFAPDGAHSIRREPAYDLSGRSLMGRTLHPTFAMTRMRLWLLLPLLLVSSQHGAWLHQLSHAAYSANLHQAQIRQTDGATESTVCPSCQSFSQLGSALTSLQLTLPAPRSHLAPTGDPQYSQPAADLPAPRSRGPPTLA